MDGLIPGMMMIPGCLRVYFGPVSRDDFLLQDGGAGFNTLPPRELGLKNYIFGNIVTILYPL